MSTDRELPAWKKVDCPTCEAIAGEPCNTEDRNPDPGVWAYKAVAPHKARRAAAAMAPQEKAE